MPEVSLEQIFKGPWGIIGDRRKEVETGPHGIFEKVFKEELDKHFVSVKRVAGLGSCSVSTAYRWIDKIKARYIIHENKALVFREDAEKILKLRAAIAVRKEAKNAV